MMYRFITALILLVVTGLLTVTDHSSPLPYGFYPLVLVVIASSYGYFVEYKPRTTKLHNRHKTVNARKLPHAKPAYHDGFIPTIFLAGGDKSYGTPPAPFFVERPDPKPKAPVKTGFTAALCSHIDRHLGFLSNPTFYDAIALALLIWSIYRGSLLAFKSVVHELTGLTLFLRSAWIPMNITYLAILVSLLAYLFRAYLAKLPVIARIASITSALRKFYLFKLDNSAIDDSFQSPTDAEPQPQSYSEPKPELNRPDASTPKANLPCVFSYNLFPSWRPPRAKSNLIAECAAAAEKRREAARLEKEASGFDFLIRTFGVLIGCEQRLAARLCGTSWLYSYRTPQTSQGCPPSHLDNPVDVPSQNADPPSTSSTTSSLPELDGDNDTSDESASLNTSAGEQPGPNDNVRIVLPPSGAPQGNLGPVRKPIVLAQVKTSPMSAPKRIVAAQVATEADKSIAVLHRSQWKQKRLVAARKEARKAKVPEPMEITEEEPTDALMESQGGPSDGTFSPMVLSPSPAQISSFAPQNGTAPMDTDEELRGARTIRGLPRRTAARSNRTDAPSTSSTSTPAPMEFTPGSTSSSYSAPRDVVMVSPKAPNVSGFNRMGSSPVPSSAQALSSVPLEVDTPMDLVDEARRFKTLPRRAAPRPNPPSTSKLASPSPTTSTPGRPLPPPASPSGPVTPTSNMKRFQPLSKSAAIPTAAAIGGRANKSAETRQVRVAPVYTLFDTERTVVQRGEYIPPKTKFEVKDEKGTEVRMTGLKGLWV